MRSDSGSADGRLVAAGVTLAIVVAAAFIAALIVTGVISGSGSESDGIAIGGDAQTLGPDADSNGSGDDAVTESESPEPTESQTSNSSAMYALGDTGDGVRELQARLRQIQWYETDVTGEFDEITVEAVRGFQAKREIEPTGEVDEETWDSLVAMTETPTEDELHNRLEPGPAILAVGDEGDEVSELQARLKEIGWFDHEVTGVYGSITAAAVEGFQTKRGIAATGEVDQNTWDILVNMTRGPTSADAAASTSPPESPATPSGIPEACSTGRVLCIDESEALLRWIVDGETETTLNVRFGTELDPVREGDSHVYWKHRDPPWLEGIEYAIFFGDGHAVHYSSESDSGESSGSVSVADEDAMKALYQQVEQGDRVVVYHS